VAHRVAGLGRSDVSGGYTSRISNGLRQQDFLVGVELERFAQGLSLEPRRNCARGRAYDMDAPQHLIMMACAELTKPGEHRGTPIAQRWGEAERVEVAIIIRGHDDISSTAADRA
jgi:hypothetical protein